MDIGTMFDFIMENKHINIELFYQRQVSNPCKELIQECYNRLQNENGCDSIIKYDGIMDYENWDELSSTAVTNASYVIVDSFVDENDEELMFPWNEKNEEWELPWDKELMKETLDDNE
uniref:Uncharacterized protein n=1 Tax=Panagrolaimus davidi TaxID=227884 RepID=A0A914PDB9_9BILA